MIHSTEARHREAIGAMRSLCDSTESGVYVLLERGELAGELDADSSRLLPVPEPYFEHEPELAPQLLPLTLPADLPQLHEALVIAERQAHRRLQTQSVAAILVGPQRPWPLLNHLAELGRQFDPTTSSSIERLLRYQDPRVMQRVWPQLKPYQRGAWLGPVLRWHAAVQPVGPMSPASEEGPPTAAALWQAEPPAAIDDAAPPEFHLSKMLSAEQWRLAHSAPAENVFWQKVSLEPRADQYALPHIDTLRGWLHEAAQHGLHEGDQADWAWLRWMLPGDADTRAGPEDDAPRPPAHPGSPHARRALAIRQRHPGLRFADAWQLALRDEP